MVDSLSRRPIGWDVIFPGQPQRPVAVAPAEQTSRLAALTSELMIDASPSTIDRILLHAVEFARSVIGLERTAIFLIDEKHQAMVGTFGTDANRATVDEHALAYEFSQFDSNTFARARAGFPWTVYDDCPHVAECGGKTNLIGRGWVACTAIAGARGQHGILFNDTALTHAPVDEEKQARAAILCALLGKALDPYPGFLVTPTAGILRGRGVVPSVTELLVRDPTLSCDSLAEQLGVTPRQLRQAFRREAKTSLVEYRNELRLDRFLESFKPSAHNLLEAAADAGFGSYAQFHRVFSARFGRGPREYFYGTMAALSLDQQKP